MTEFSWDLILLASRGCERVKTPLKTGIKTPLPSKGDALYYEGEARYALVVRVDWNITQSGVSAQVYISYGP